MCRYAPTHTYSNNPPCICSPDCCICTAGYVIGCHQTTQRTLCHRPVNDLPDQGYCTCGGKHSPSEAVVSTCVMLRSMTAGSRRNLIMASFCLKTPLMRFRADPAFIVLGDPLLLVCLLSHCCALKSCSVQKLKYAAIKSC